MASGAAIGMVRLQLLAMGLVLLAASSEQFYANRYGKRQEFAPPRGQVGFQSGSRYGRTDPDAAPLGPDDRLQRRFYANGRYGKRSPGAPEYQLLEDGSMPQPVTDEDAQIACRYTGVANLYRCARRKDGEDMTSFLQDAAAAAAGGAVTGNPLN